MSMVLRDAPLTTRNARAKLDSGMHWRGIAPDVHLGYPARRPRRAVAGALV
jgi:hypothetical protein